jgi:malate dehydrogenase (oxaloacetate-decarboxylating)
MDEMFSIVYTPTEGDAIQNFSRVFRRPQGCFLNINDIGRVRHDLAQWGTPEDIDYIVVTGTCVPRDHKSPCPLSSLTRV